MIHFKRLLVLISLTLLIVPYNWGHDTLLIAAQKNDSLFASIPPDITIENNIPSNSPTFWELFVPIFGVIVGFILGVLKDILSNRKRILVEGKEWTENFMQLQDPLKLQIVAIDKFLIENPEDTYELTDPTVVEKLNCQEFDFLNPKSLVSYLNGKKNIDYKEAVKTAGKMKSSVRIIQSNYNNLMDAFNSLTDNTRPYFQEFNETLPLFRKSLAKYIDDISTSPLSQPYQKILCEKFIQLLDAEITPSLQGVPLNVFRFAENFIRPFFQLAYNDRGNKSIDECIVLLSQCDHSITALKTERRYLRIKLGKIKSSYQNNLDSLNEIIILL